jgi:UDP-N-acetylglucosamine 2-epimerase
MCDLNTYFNREDVGSTVLRNVGLHPPHYKKQQPRLLEMYVHRRENFESHIKYIFASIQKLKNIS